MSDCPVITQALDCNIHLCLYCWLFWGRSDVGFVYYCRHDRRMFRSTIWKWLELSDSLCDTLCCQPCLCILIPTLLNCLNQTSHSLCNKYRAMSTNQSGKKIGLIGGARKFLSCSKTFHTARIAKQRVERKYELKIQACFVNIPPLITILKSRKVKTEMYSPTGQVDFNFFSCCVCALNYILYLNHLAFNCSFIERLNTRVLSCLLPHVM